ncbi:MAG: CDP-alcohol phosphatidyltransferase family protein, partial [Allobaculum sp.]|nr:CDP-alcohol phosphatidyltransferase family protein [Allobaculum sp.]
MSKELGKSYKSLSYKELYRDIRVQSKIREFRKAMLAGHFLTRDIGRICSVWFIKHNIVPNQITLLMIMFGIIGSILFAIPNVWCKILGYCGWLMWFAMDCSDGQVARYTKTFSKYGTEMDYMAHLIDHPLMNMA